MVTRMKNRCCSYNFVISRLRRISSGVFSKCVSSQTAVLHSFFLSLFRFLCVDNGDVLNDSRKKFFFRVFFCFFNVFGFVYKFCIAIA